MVKTFLATALSLFAGVAVAAPTFNPPSVEQAHKMWLVADAVLKQDRDVHHLDDLLSFGVMLGTTWINVHKQDALTEAAKHGRNYALPEEVWELPYASDWVGCMLWQFQDPDIFVKAHFSSFDTAETTLVGWIDKNAKLLDSSPELKIFRGQLEALPDWAQQCEKIARNQLKEGEIAL